MCAHAMMTGNSNFPRLILVAFACVRVCSCSCSCDTANLDSSGTATAVPLKVYDKSHKFWYAATRALRGDDKLFFFLGVG